MSHLTESLLNTVLTSIHENMLLVLVLRYMTVLSLLVRVLI